MQSNRRDFLKGCCAAALGAGAGRAMAFFDPFVTTGAKAQTGNVLVYLFLRGAIDGLHLLVPYSGGERAPYVTKRAGLAIPESRLRPIGASGWAWHPRAGGGAGDAVGSTPKWLQKLYNDGRLGVMHATGMPTANRSHFEAQAMMEMGTPGSTGSSSGWLARYLATASGTHTPVLAPAVGFSGNLQTSLIGANDAVSMRDAQSFRVDGFHWGWNDSDGDLANHAGAHTKLLPLWQGDSSLEVAGRTAAEALAFMRSKDFALQTPENADGYLPAGGAVYPSSHGADLGRQLRNLAQIIRMPNNGLIAAAVDYGFWDTHESQGMPEPGNANQYDTFGNLTEGLGAALEAFQTDLNAAGQMQRVTVVIQSEFGRRFRPNESGGTDHGYANLMLALGNKVNGGQLHGTFPGLADGDLFEGQDVDVTTDFRQVLSEALVKRMGLPTNQVAQVFPGFAYTAGQTNLFQA